MGVRYLSSFISKNSSIFLKPFELCNCYLVIDGSSITYNLYHWSSKSHGAFAGDYDEYYRTVTEFFLILKKCKIRPIVMFDGGYASTKLNTVLTRAYVKDFRKGFKNKHFFPLFMKNAFFDVMADLKIICVQCNLEADHEIAAVARALKCPVLSYDSDFYIFDVLYIPFSTVYEEPVKFENRNQYYIRCSIYNVENLLNHFSGFDKALLPIAAMILGNDLTISSNYDKNTVQKSIHIKKKKANKNEIITSKKEVSRKNKTFRQKTFNRQQVFGQKPNTGKNKGFRRKIVVGQRKVIRQTDKTGQILSIKRNKAHKQRKDHESEIIIQPKVINEETITTRKKKPKLKRSVISINFGLKKNDKIKNRYENILALFNWLKNESFESAIKKILSCTQIKNKILSAIKSNVKFYTNNVVSKSVIENLEHEFGCIGLKRKVSDIYIPTEIEQLFSQCKIHKLVVDIIALCIYIPQVQVEKGNYKSAHFAALQIIKSIYLLLFPYLKKKEPLKIYLSANCNFGFVKINPDPSNILSKVNLEKILKSPLESRLSWLYHIVKIDKKDMDLFTSDWSIFLMSAIYWIKVLNKQIKFVHIHALVLMVIANKVVQKSVGYFRNHKKFMKSKGNLLKKLKDSSIKIGKSTDFNGMLESVTLYEKLIIHSELMPYRKVSEEITKECYDLSAVHLFSCFQSCLFHIMQLNALLNYPLPYLKISDFYSGTILFNFYSVINYFFLKNKGPVENFGCNLFKNTPNLAKLYKFLSQSLCKYSENPPPIVIKRRRKKKKNKTSNKNESSEDEVIFNEVDDDDDDDYSDENNPYAVLRDSCM